MVSSALRPAHSFLVVEDVLEVAKNNCTFLKIIDANASCRIAQSSESAIRELGLELPNLMVVDLQLGDRIGADAARGGLELLGYTFQKYPRLNILVYATEPTVLKPLADRINRHRSGFVIVNKLERRTEFVRGARQALLGKKSKP